MSALDHHSHLDPAAMLPDGTVVVARRGRARDLDALRALAARSGVVCDELELARLLRSDPAERLILCATHGDAVIGLGVIELTTVSTMPSLILVEPSHGRPLAAWLAETLVAQARAAV